MDKWFFVEVQTYMSVNNMGRELGQYVYDKYNQAVVHKDCLIGISNDIKEKMSELEEKYPRCKKFKFEIREYQDRYKETVTDISVRPDNSYNDNYVFILRTKYVRKMNLECTLLIK